MQAALKNEEPKRITLHSLAVNAYRSAGGNIPQAKAALIMVLQKDEALLESIVDDAVSNAIGHSLHKVATRHRENIVKAAESPKGAGRAAVVALATGMAAGYLDWPLANGIKLRNATREDLVDSINRYSAVAATNTTRANWLQLVLQSMPSDALTVGDRLTEERISELYKEVSAS
jgi:hypothetical protein